MNDVDFFNKNYSRWYRVGGYCAEKYAKYTYQDKEDLIQEGMLVIWGTILNFEWRTPSFLQDRCNSGIFAAYKRGKSVDNHYQNKSRRRYPVSIERIDDLAQDLLDKKASPEEIAITSIMLKTFYNRLNRQEQLFLKLRLAGYYLKEIKQIIGVSSRKLKNLRKNMKNIYEQVYE